MATNLKSEALMKELQLSIQLDDVDKEQKSRFEWEQAVAEELKALYVRQGELEKQFDQFRIDESLPFPRAKVSDESTAYDNINSKFEAMSNVIDKLMRDLLECQNKVKVLEDENKTLAQKNTLLKKSVDDLNANVADRRDLSALKNFFVSQIDDATTNLERDLSEHGEILNNLSEQITSMPTGAVGGNSRKIKIDLPKFKGQEFESPMKYIADIKKYVQCIKPLPTELPCVISQSLEDSAKNWWYLQNQNIKCIDDFVEVFKEHYWNASIQRNAKRRIEFGRYNTMGKQTRVEYAINMFTLIKELEIDEPESESIERFRDHFDKNIRHAMIGQQIKTKSEFFKILTDYDNDDRKERMAQNKVAYHNKGPVSPKTNENQKQWPAQKVNAIRTHSTPKNTEKTAKTNELGKNKKDEKKNVKTQNKKIVEQYDREVNILDIDFDEIKYADDEFTGNEQ